MSSPGFCPGLQYCYKSPDLVLNRDAGRTNFFVLFFIKLIYCLKITKIGFSTSFKLT